jgi:hypothetical protein
VWIIADEGAINATAGTAELKFLPVRKFKLKALPKP